MKVPYISTPIPTGLGESDKDKTPTTVSKQATVSVHSVGPPPQGHET